MANKICSVKSEEGYPGMNITQSPRSARLGTRTLSCDGYTMIVASPAEEPALWAEYLRGARAEYRRQGCAAALDFTAVLKGVDTCLFFALVDDDGRVRAGLRVQHPLSVAAPSHAVEEWHGNPAQVDLVNAIEERLGEGVVEVKTAWVDSRWSLARPAAGHLSRLGLPIMELCGVDHMMATAAEHVLQRWESGGGRVDHSVAPAAYPSDRYRTRLMWWRRTALPDLTTRETWTRMREETDLLLLGVKALASK